MVDKDGLKSTEITRIVNRYIGAPDGNLSDFSYNSLADFYAEYCDLDIDATKAEGRTKRLVFINILKDQNPKDQAAILRGVLEKCPVGSLNIRTAVEAKRVEILIAQLEGQVIEVDLTIGSTRTALREALSDAEQMIKSGKPENAVDRTHTAFHDHLKAICDEQNWTYDRDESVGKLFRNIVDYHPDFQEKGERNQDISMILNGMATIIGSLNPIRNRVSLAHANKSLLQEPEAFLYINTIRTMMQYLDSKITRQ